jgi:hypothetical protein
MYKNLAATLVAACFISPAFSQSPASLKTGLAEESTFIGAHSSGMHSLWQGALARLNP